MEIIAIISQKGGAGKTTLPSILSLSHSDADKDDALRGIRSLVTDVVADMRANGEAVPEPLAERKHSGNFQTWISTELHRRLAIEAAEAGVSLNRLVSLRLAMPLTCTLPRVSPTGQITVQAGASFGAC